MTSVGLLRLAGFWLIGDDMVAVRELGCCVKWNFSNGENADIKEMTA